jgi:hypothetical protein
VITRFPKLCRRAGSGGSADINHFLLLQEVLNPDSETGYRAGVHLEAQTSQLQVRDPDSSAKARYGVLFICAGNALASYSMIDRPISDRVSCTLFPSSLSLDAAAVVQ